MYFSFAWKMTTRLIKSVKWGNVAPITLLFNVYKTQHHTQSLDDYVWHEDAYNSSLALD